jgi:hypothetical protein
VGGALKHLFFGGRAGRRPPPGRGDARRRVPCRGLEAPVPVASLEEGVVAVDLPQEVLDRDLPDTGFFAERL